MSNSITDTALNFLGVPYVYGGADPSGFDCSGLVQYSYALNGLSIPRTAQEQYNSSTKISQSQLKPGDLVFSGTDTDDISHVMMYIGDGQIVEAPYTGANVRTTTLSSVKNIVGYGTYNTSSNTVSGFTKVNTLDDPNLSASQEIFFVIVKIIALLSIAIIATAFFFKAFNIKVI